MQQAEQALQKSEASLNKFAKASAILIDTFLLRPDGSVAIPYASPSIQEIFALNPEDVAQDASEVFKRILPEDNVAMQITIRESARTLAAWRCEFRVHHPRKGLIWVEGNSIPEKLDDGSILWHGILTDITPASTINFPFGRAVKRSQRFQAGIVLPWGRKIVPTGSALKMASRMPSPRADRFSRKLHWP